MQPRPVAAWFYAAVAVVAARLGPDHDDRTPPPPPTDAFRLPAGTAPESYDLRFELGPDAGAGPSTFGGVARIAVRAVAAARVVTLHVKDLTVGEVTVTGPDDGGDGRLAAVRLAYRPQNEQLDVHLSAAMTPGRRYRVTVAYEGRVRRDTAVGLFAKPYRVGDATKWLTVTHLQPIYARRVFPCYDEPLYKAIFNVSVVKRKHLVALSNMPVRTVSDTGNDTEMVSFQSTPPMSSYLVAIFVGEFVPNRNGSLITIYTRPGDSDRTAYVWNEAARHLRALEQYTGIGYALPKLDILAIPDDYNRGMENWGLNVYEETYLLANERSKDVVMSARVVQHEFAHQWFGNLVTCSWWDYAWLNEGFANYFEFFVTGTMNTGWPMDEMFVVETHQESLAYDQYPRAPITRSVRSSREIEHAFDMTTYGKAATVLRMLRHLVTEQHFRSSVRKYLNDNRNNAVVPNQLYAAFDDVLTEHGYVLGNDLTVNQFMSNWTLQPGYPVLNVVKNETSNTFSITQSRFFIHPGNGARDNGGKNAPAWHVGLTYTTETSKDFDRTIPSAWTNRTSDTTVIPAPEASGWYVFNVQSTGFYRVNYDANNWMALTRQLMDSAGAIHVLNRAQLIDDAFHLAMAERLNYLVPLRLSEYLINERSVTPWRPAMKGLRYLFDQMPRRADEFAALKAHVDTLAGVVHRMLDEQQPGEEAAVNVENVRDELSWAYTADNGYFAAKALERYGRWLAGENISDAHAKAAFCTGVRNGTGSDAFDRMFGVYTTRFGSAAEKKSAGFALGCSRNRTQLTKYVNHILDGSRGPIMAYEYRTVVHALSTTPLGIEVLFEFLSNNWNRVLRELSFGKFVVSHMYWTLAGLAAGDDELTKLRHLKDNAALPATVRLLFEETLYDVDRNYRRWFEAPSTAGVGQWARERGAREPSVV